MTPLPLTRIGDQHALVLPEELLSHLQLSDGDEVQAIVTANGVELVVDPDKAKQLELARKVMKEDRQTLSKLAE